MPLSPTPDLARGVHKNFRRSSVRSTCADDDHDRRSSRTRQRILAATVIGSVAGRPCARPDGGRDRPMTKPSPSPGWFRQRPSEWFTDPRILRPVGLYLTGEEPNVGNP
jgi:hypothetical protein